MDVIVDTQNGIAVPEGRVVETVNQLIKDFCYQKSIPAIGTNELVNEFRLRVKRGELQVNFIFNDKTFKVAPTGQICNEWPAGEFPGELLDRQLSELLE